ncbi:efflux transporter outer membrane subunit [Neisseria sp. S1]|uniref:efflux transporter outer membrane subunit n=1 Tax=Neisseria sp. S1 TaxID=3318354 RepID=UPI003A860423
MMKTKVPVWSVGLLAVVMLSACQNTSVPLKSQIEIPQKFDHAAAAKGSTEIKQWWRNWHDPVLTALIEQGLTQNHDMRIALSRLNEARAINKMAEADMGPMVGLSGSAGLIRGNADNPLNRDTRALLGRFPQTSNMADDTQSIQGSSLTGGFTASWEPDIFGAKRSDADAAGYASIGVQEQVYGAQILLAADIADNYFQARAAQKSMQISQQRITVMQRMLQYVTGRFQSGQQTRYEVGDVESKLTALQARQATIQTEYDTAVRKIAVLIGQTPQQFNLPESSIDVLAIQPAAPSGQTPQGMLGRRPDIRAQEAQVNAYAAKLASAKADLLPRFTINFLGQGGKISVDSDSALKGWGNLLSVGIQVPIFTNGRLKANIAASDARLLAALLQYDQAVLRALGEVDSTYQAKYALSRQSLLLAKAQQQAARQAADAQKLFKYGHKTLDEALKARLMQYEMAENLLHTQVTGAQASINLYKALGGGW